MARVHTINRCALQSDDCAQATIQTLLILQLWSWSAARTNADAETAPGRAEDARWNLTTDEWIEWWTAIVL